MKFTARECAAWVLCGHPMAAVPFPLKALSERIEKAVEYAANRGVAARKLATEKISK